jgi:hypothetical protein
MPKAARKSKSRPAARKPTSARLLKNRPHDPTDEPPENVPSAEGRAKKPRQARLPEMEDNQIEELEVAAESYAAIRDERMALTPQEKKLKDDLLAAMKRHSKEKYVRDGIEIKVVHEKETVKVRVKKTGEEE